MTTAVFPSRRMGDQGERSNRSKSLPEFSEGFNRFAPFKPFIEAVPMVSGVHRFAAFQSTYKPNGSVQTTKFG